MKKASRATFFVLQWGKVAVFDNVSILWFRYGFHTGNYPGQNTSALALQNTGYVFCSENRLEIQTEEEIQKTNAQIVLNFLRSRLKSVVKYGALAGTLEIYPVLLFDD